MAFPFRRILCPIDFDYAAAELLAVAADGRARRWAKLLVGKSIDRFPGWHDSLAAG
jgi:hypothetical protein